MKLKSIVVGSVLISTSQIFTQLVFTQQVFAQQAVAQQAVAQEDTSSEIRLLKAKLKQLEQRVESQGRKERELEAQAKASTQEASNKMPQAYKAAPSAFDPCPAGKVCYKGITLTFGGWVDLAAIYRSRNIVSDTGSVYSSIPFAQSKNFNTQEARFSARQSRFSLLAEGDAGANTHLAGYGEIDFEGAAQTANSVATNSFNPRMRQASLEVDRTDLGLHFLAGQSWSLNAPSKVGIDPRGVDAPGVIDFESVPGFIAARQPGVRVWQDFGPEFKLALSAENAATSFVGGNVPLVGTPAVGPQGVLNPNLLVNLTGPGGSFFNNANNLSLNQVPDVTIKGAWDPRLGPNKLHIEAWALYRDFYDRFNFANHDVSMSVSAVISHLTSFRRRWKRRSRVRMARWAATRRLRSRTRRCGRMVRSSCSQSPLCRLGWSGIRRRHWISTAMPDWKRPAPPSPTSARCRSATATRFITTPAATSRIRPLPPATAIPRRSGSTPWVSTTPF